MTERSTLWRAGAALFAVINLGGMLLAAGMGEQLHAAGHAVLMFLGLGAYVIWRLGPQRQDLPGTQQADDRIEYLQQSVDAIALEVERIGEAQRFNDKLRAERDVSLPSNKPQ